MSEPPIPDAGLPEGEDWIVAGELALGVLEGEPRAAALRRTLAEPAFAVRVTWWNERLAALFDMIPGIAPPDHVFPRIEEAIATPRSSPVVAIWRGVAIAAMAVAACLALLLVTRAPPSPVPTPADQTLVAQVADKAGEPLLVASFDRTSGALRVRTSNLPQGELRPELWVIGGDGVPKSLGLVALNGASDVAPGGLASALVPGATFAVTMEPVKDAPHKAPSGTILGTAKLAAI